MAPSGSERLTNRQSGRSPSASDWPERVAQVRIRRTAPPDQPAADPSSLPVSRPRNGMNQRIPSASTGEFFNTIRQKLPLAALQLPLYPRKETQSGRLNVPAEPRVSGCQQLM